MISFFRLMVSIALFQRRPEEVSYSVYLMWQALLVAAFLNLLVGVVQGVAFSKSFAELVVSFAFFSLVVGCLLIARGFQARLVQTFTVLFGISAVMHVALLGVVVLKAMQLPDNVVQLLAVTLAVWSIAADGFVLTSALNIPRPVGVVIAVLILIAQIVFVSSVTGSN